MYVGVDVSQGTTAYLTQGMLYVGLSFLQLPLSSCVHMFFRDSPSRESKHSTHTDEDLGPLPSNMIFIKYDHQGSICILQYKNMQLFYH